MKRFSDLPIDVVLAIFAAIPDSGSLLNFTIASGFTFRIYKTETASVLNGFLKHEGYREIRNLLHCVVSSGEGVVLPTSDQAIKFNAGQTQQNISNPLRVLLHLKRTLSLVNTITGDCLSQHLDWMNDAIDGIQSTYLRQVRVFRCNNESFSNGNIHDSLYPKRTFTAFERLRVRRAVLRLLYYCNPRREGAGLVELVDYSRGGLADWELVEMLTVSEYLRDMKASRKRKQYCPFSQIQVTCLMIAQILQYRGFPLGIDACRRALQEGCNWRKQNAQSGAANWPSQGWYYMISQGATDPSYTPRPTRAYRRLGIAFWDRWRLVNRRMIDPAWPNENIAPEGLEEHYPSSFEEIRNLDLPRHNLERRMWEDIRHHEIEVAFRDALQFQRPLDFRSTRFDMVENHGRDCNSKCRFRKRRWRWFVGYAVEQVWRLFHTR